MWKSGPWLKNAKARSNETVLSLICMVVCKDFVDAYLLVTKGGKLISPLRMCIVVEVNFRTSLDEENRVTLWFGSWSWKPCCTGREWPRKGGLVLLGETGYQLHHRGTARKSQTEGKKKKWETECHRPLKTKMVSIMKISIQKWDLFRKSMIGVICWADRENVKWGNK